MVAMHRCHFAHNDQFALPQFRSLAAVGGLPNRQDDGPQSIPIDCQLQVAIVAAVKVDIDTVPVAYHSKGHARLRRHSRVSRCGSRSHLKVEKRSETSWQHLQPSVDSL